MTFNSIGNKENPCLLLLPGLGVSHEIFLPLIELMRDKFHVIAAGIDGFLLGKESKFTSVDDQAAQAISYVNEHLNGHLDVAYGLSLGGKILSRMLERNEIVIDHAIMDAAPLLPLPKWLVDPLRYYQSANVWTCYHWTGFWRWVFCFWMNAERSGLMGKEKPSGKDTKTFIPTNWNPSTGLISISGTAPKKRLSPSLR